MSPPEAQKSRFAKYPSPVTLRLSQEEIDRLDQMIRGQSRSDFIRKQLFGEQVQTRQHRPKTPKKDDIAIAQILAMLGASKMGNNLNQIAKAANGGTLIVDEDVIAQIEQCYAFHLAIRTMLIEALGMKPDSPVQDED